MLLKCNIIRNLSSTCTYRKAHSGAGLVKVGRFLLVSGVTDEPGRKNQNGHRDLRVFSVPGGNSQPGSSGGQNSSHTFMVAFKMESLPDISPVDTFYRKKRSFFNWKFCQNHNLHFAL